jgi:hypothetical protein
MLTTLLLSVIIFAAFWLVARSLISAGKNESFFAGIVGLTLIAAFIGGFVGVIGCVIKYVS